MEEKKKTNYLEVDDTKKNKIDLANIVSNNEKLYKESMQSKYINTNKPRERDNSPNFVDDFDVPPLC